MRITLKKMAALGLTLVMLASFALSMVACSCGGDSEPTPPETGYPQKNDMKYGSAIEQYKKTDFSASWIWTSSTSEDSYVAFRKTFDLAAAPGDVTAYASAESKYFMWVNGEMTVYDGSVKRGPTPYDSYCDVITIDNLKAGKNTLAFLVPYNGRSGDSSVDAALALGEGETQGGLLFEMKVGDQVIKSDHTFKAKRLTSYKNRVLLGAEYPSYPQMSMLAERNMWYDARDEVGDYTATEYNDADWDNATLIAKAGALPFGDLYTSTIPLIEFGDIIDFANSADYVGKTLSEKTTLTLDLPLNRQFSAYFEVEAAAGKKLTYYTDTFQTGTTTSYTFKDTYVTKEGTQSYESYPWRSGSKLIIEAEAGVKFNKIGYRPSGYNSKMSGKFISSDEDLDALWQKCGNTLQICMRDSFMDCPDRERGPYMGDATNEMDFVYYAMDTNAIALVKKSILACIGWTGKDGLIPSRAPSIKSHEIPVQSLAFSTAVYNYWLNTGDKETVNAYYIALIDYLKVWQMKENGMPEYRSGEWEWIDWGDFSDSELIHNCWYYFALSTAAKMANGLGVTTDDAFLSDRMGKMKTAFDGLYKQDDGFRSGANTDDRANALAVLSGLADTEDWSVVTSVLSRVMNASPYMERYVLEALCKMGKYDVAVERIKTRYADMIASDDTTVWELFKRDDGTNNHGWASGPLLIMSEYLGGISPTKAGYETYEIVPQNLFDSLEVSTQTVKGEIAVKYAKQSNVTTFTLKTIQAEGLVKIPLSFGSTIDGSGFTNMGVSDGYSVLKFNEAGTFTVTAK